MGAQFLLLEALETRKKKGCFTVFQALKKIGVFFNLFSCLFVYTYTYIFGFVFYLFEPPPPHARVAIGDT